MWEISVHLRMIKVIILKRVFLCQEDDVQYMLALRYVGIRRTRLTTTFLSIFELNWFCFQANVRTPKYTKKFVLISGMTAFAWPPVKTVPFFTGY